MSTIVREESAGSSFLMFVLALLVLGAVGFGIYYMSGASPQKVESTTINLPEPKAPSLPEAPSLPTPAPTPAD